MCHASLENPTHRTSSIFIHLHPTSITHMVNAFSASVLGATFPNPTEVNELNVKYSAVIYLDWKKKNK